MLISRRILIQAEEIKLAAMFCSSISTSKLHAGLIILIVFVLTFLSVPLLLISLANTNFEAVQDEIYDQALGVDYISPDFIEPINGSSVDGEVSNATIGRRRSLNCTLFAIKKRLMLVDENILCPVGYFPCESCPEICIEQRRNCNGKVDCPDRSDEINCTDRYGVIVRIFHDIFSGTTSTKNEQSGSGTALRPRPESCTKEQFELEDRKCPCVLNDTQVIICSGQNLQAVPVGLYDTVHKLRLDNNSITSIDNVPWPRSLSTLVLDNNLIAHIGRSIFDTALNLSKLYLNRNEITAIDSEAFTGLASLLTLHIERNKLQTFNSSMLRHTPSVGKLFLSENNIDLPEETSFSHCSNLKHLLLDHNRISMVRKHWFSNMTKLIWLSLSYNKIRFIEGGSFDWNYELEELNLSFNEITVINREIFTYSLNIQRLYLGNNPLQPLTNESFREIVQLKSLDLTDVNFDTQIDKSFFDYLKQLEFIYFAQFRYCHHAPHVRVCHPVTDGLSSMDKLLVFPIFKYAVWTVALVCSLSNIFVFIWRSVSSDEDKTLSLFVRNLSLADLMMGIYLSSIGYFDFEYRNSFRTEAAGWMASWKCTAIGFLAIFSSELSVFTLTIITIERYRSITSIMQDEEEAQKRRAWSYVLIAWLISFLIAVYPLAQRLLQDHDYYASNSLCLPLHIDQPYSPGWVYSFVVYLCINFAAILTIIVLYVHMYAMIMNIRQSSRPALLKGEKREDALLAIRFFFIVITGCLCFIPIVVIKIIALTNMNISSSIYGWLVVFIIPINSALNPIVYTLAAPTSLRSTVWCLFKRVFYELDSLTNGTTQDLSQELSSIGTGHLDVSNVISNGRSKTGSNSTTCDTLDTSIVSNSKVSMESTIVLISANGSKKCCSNSTELLHKSSTITSSPMIALDDSVLGNGPAYGCPNRPTKDHSYRTIGFSF